MKAFYCIILGLSLCKFTVSQYETNCNTRETCGECIQTLNCIWCTEPNFNIENGPFKFHCENKNNITTDAWCSPDKIYAPEHQVYILENEPLRSETDDRPYSIQMKPQNLKLSLRKGAEYFLDFQYQHGETKLTQNPVNAVTLVSGNFNNVNVDSVIIKDNSEKEIEIKYSSDCLEPTENGCNNIHAGEIINFKAAIRALQCQPDGLNSYKIKINPAGINKSLQLELQIICDCPCEKPNSSEIISQSPLCDNHGDLKCGVCSCYPGRYGRNCECQSSTTSHKNDVTACTTLINGEVKVCSGFGSCICGQCECTKRTAPSEIYYGNFCECDNFSCQRDGGEICSGINKGVCDCGICKCLEGWTGEACQCSLTNSTCIAPGSNSVCNSRGSCSCGECECHTVDGYRYSGKYCEECLSCPGQRCEELRHCVECQAFKSGSYNETDCITKCTSFTSIIVEKIGDEDLEDVQVCRSPDSSGCTIIFQYAYDKANDLL